MSGEVFERRFTVDARPELSISNVAGRIDIRAGEGSVVTLHATKRGSAGAVENTQIECSHDGNRVQIQTKGEKGGLLNLSRNVSSVDYELVVPRDCEIQAEAVSATVRVQDVAAAVRAQTVSGEVTLEDVAGECQITTVSGDASGHRIVGALSLRTTSGDATIRQSQLSHFNLNSVSGDFSVETPLIPGQHYLAKTVSGDLELLVPEGTGATVQMKTVSGDVRSDLPAQIIKAGRRHWQGQIGGGGANVEMSSVSGDLRVAHASGATASPGRRPQPAFVPDPHPEPFPSPPELPPLDLSSGIPTAEPAAGSSASGSETSAILKALEQGEITVEEAIARLDDLQ